MKAGTYMVIDPCYIDAKCDVWFTTKHGDGVYEDSDGYEYPVDSGRIGLVDVLNIKDEPSSIIPKGRLVEFEKDFEVGYDNYVLTVGDEVVLDLGVIGFA